MKKYLFLLMLLTVITTKLSVFSKPNINSINQQQEVNLKQNLFTNPVTFAVANNLIKIDLNDTGFQYKVYINRSTWVDVFLPWFGDVAIGLISKEKMADNIAKEYKNWTFHRMNHWMVEFEPYTWLANCTYSHLASISGLIFSSDSINRIVMNVELVTNEVTVLNASV